MSILYPIFTSRSSSPALKINRPTESVQNAVVYTLTVPNGNENLGAGIVSTTQNSIKTLLTTEDIVVYKPEIIAAYNSPDSYYMCECTNQDTILSTSLVEDFDRGNHTITLLDMMVHCIHDMSSSYNRNAIAPLHMEVVLYKENDVFLTKIPIELFEAILHKSLIRVNPIYQNVPVQKACEHYFQYSIIPKLLYRQ